MPLLFANPIGLFALLGIPVVLAVHFLHRHRKAIDVSTLFLIDISREPARSGRRWHQLIPSVPMWLQLLLVLLITALLSQPYRPQGVLQVAVVVDDSASMRAFRSNLASGLSDLNDKTSAGGRKTEWLILPANPTRPRLYSGDNPTEWFSTLSSWSPANGWRDPNNALRLARDRVGPNGLVVYATDSPDTQLPAEVALLSVGNPLSNVGIAGITTEQKDDEDHWQAVIINRSNSPENRAWSLEWNGQEKSPTQAVSLPANGISTIGGVIPENATRLTLRLSNDDFTLDDTHHFVRHAPKPLSMAILGEGTPPWFIERMPRAIPRLTLGAAPVSDFALIAHNDGEAIPPVAGIVFSSAGERDAPFRNETPVSSSHPLVRNLAWAGLAVQKAPAPPPAPDDTVLLWAGGDPLISLRPPAQTQADETATTPPETEPAPRTLPPAGPQLIFHFNPSLSNLERIPAGAILLLRFAESLRAEKSATAWRQLETGQAIARLLPSSAKPPLVVESLNAAGEVIESHPMTSAERAPEKQMFIRVRDAKGILLESAVSFADARESDFRECAPSNTTANAIVKTANVSKASDDALWPLLIIASLTALLVLYHLTGPTKETDPRGALAAAPTTPAAGTTQ